MPTLKSYTIQLYTLICLIALTVNLYAEEINIEIIDNINDRQIEELLNLVNENPENLDYSLELSEKLAKYYYRNSQYNNALDSYFAALKTAKVLKNSEKIIKNRYNIGILYTKLGNFPLAIDYLSKILLDNDCDKSSLTDSFMSDIYGELATAYLYMGDYPKSSEFQIKALRIREELQDLLGVGKSQYTFGNMYFQQQNYEEAKKHYEEALQIWKSIDYQNGYYRCYAALGSIYSKLDDVERALQYSLVALELAEKLQNPAGIGYTLHTVGENYRECGDYDIANEHFQRSLKKMLEIEDKNGQIIVLEAIGNLYLIQNNTQQSLKSLTSALQLAEEIGASPRLQELYLSIAKNYDSTGNTEKAFAYKEKHIQLKNSLMDENDLELINQMQINYKLEKGRKEQSIAQLQQQNEFQNLYLIIGVSIIVLLLSLIAIGYTRYQIRLKKRDLLHAQQATISIEKEEIQDSNEDLERFVYVVAHDLREPLRMIERYSGFLNSHLKSVSSSNTQQQLTEVKSESKRMKLLLDNLLKYSRLDQDENTLVSTDLNDILNKAEAKQYRNITLQNANITKDYLPIIEAFPNQLWSLFEVLIGNAIKFRKEGIPPAIHIGIEEQAEQNIISISDNGIGIAEEKQEFIFELFKKGHNNPQYDGNGFGLAYCKKIMDLHKGNIEVKSQLQEGTTFLLSFPKAEVIPPKNGKNLPPIDA
ncbi:MAG: tetratricopeptide repeat protein [Chitinophagales bacterium]